MKQLNLMCVKCNLAMAISKFSPRAYTIKSAIEMIVAFFDRHGGVKSFRWRDATVRVSEYSVKALGGIVYKISFKFKEV